MAGYGCARTYAHMLGLTEQSALLQRTLDEEGDLVLGFLAGLRPV